MKKRIGSLLLILALCFTLLPTAAFAADSTAAWDGTADTSWYTDHKTDTEYHFSIRLMVGVPACICRTPTIRRILNTISPLPNSWPV